MWSPMHRFYLEGPNSVCLCSVVHLVCCVCRRVPTPMCSLMHHVFCVCLDWPKVCTCAHQCTTSVSVCLEGPIWYVLSNAPLLLWRGPSLLNVLNNALCFLCLPEDPNLFCAHQCTTSATVFLEDSKTVFPVSATESTSSPSGLLSHSFKSRLYKFT